MKQATGNGQQATGNGQQATGNGQQATGNRRKLQAACGSRGKKARRKSLSAARGELPVILDSLPIVPELRYLAVPIGTLRADPKNVRQHGERNIESIAASLKKFGQQAPVLFVIQGKSRIVVKGNGVLAAARSLGWKHLAALRTDLAGDAAKAFGIADNRTSDLSEFDTELLATQLKELDETNFDLNDVGFSDEELRELLDQTVPHPDGDNADPGAPGRRRGERTAVFVAGHLKWEIPRQAFDRWMASIEGKVGNDPDRVVKEIKRRLGLQ